MVRMADFTTMFEKFVKRRSHLKTDILPLLCYRACQGPCCQLFVTLRSPLGLAYPATKTHCVLDPRGGVCHANAGWRPAAATTSCCSPTSGHSPVPAADRPLGPPPPASQPTGLVGKACHQGRLSAAATVITVLFYLWPPGIHAASSLLVILYHQPQFCLSVCWGRRYHYSTGALREEKEAISLWERRKAGGFTVPARCLTVAGDRRGPRERPRPARTSCTLAVVSGGPRSQFC